MAFGATMFPSSCRETDSVISCLFQTDGRCRKFGLIVNKCYTCTVTGDLQGPFNLIWLNKNVLPPGMTMVGELLSRQVAFHVAANAFGHREDAPISKQKI
jgi:hypothetical protein